MKKKKKATKIYEKGILSEILARNNCSLFVRCSGSNIIFSNKTKRKKWKKETKQKKKTTDLHSGPYKCVYYYYIRVEMIKFIYVEVKIVFSRDDHCCVVRLLYPSSYWKERTMHSHCVFNKIYSQGEIMFYR